MNDCTNEGKQARKQYVQMGSTHNKTTGHCVTNDWVAEENRRNQKPDKKYPSQQTLLVSETTARVINIQSSKRVKQSLKELGIFLHLEERVTLAFVRRLRYHHPVPWQLGYRNQGCSLISCPFSAAV